MSAPAESSASPKTPMLKDTAGNLPIGVLEVCVHAATDLVGPYTKTQVNPKKLKYVAMNPLVKLELKELEHQHLKSAVPDVPSSPLRQLGASGASHAQMVTTTAASNTQNAVYNPQFEKFEFLVYSCDSILVATVLNTKDSNPFRGMVEITLDEFTTYQEKVVRGREKYVLMPDEAHRSQTVTGTVELSLAYWPIEKSKVTVTVEDGRNVCCAKNQMANVLVSAGITTPNAKSIEQTKIVSNENGSPLWSETLHFEYRNGMVDNATLDVSLAETYQGQGRSATVVKGHPIGALSLPLKDLLAAQKDYNQAIVDELMPEASILKQYHPMVNSAGETKGEVYLLISVESPEIVVTRKKAALEEAAVVAALMPKNLEQEGAFRNEKRKTAVAQIGTALVSAVKLAAVLGVTVGSILHGHRAYKEAVEAANKAEPAPQKAKPAPQKAKPAPPPESKVPGDHEMKKRGVAGLGAIALAWGLSSLI